MAAFEYRQALEIRDAFARHGVRYLFIGKSGAILPGDHDPAGPERQLDLIALHQALTRLATFDAQQTRIVEIRFFGGLTVEETADVLNVSPTTVKREWASARAWLHHELTAS